MHAAHCLPIFSLQKHAGRIQFKYQALSESCHPNLPPSVVPPRLTQPLEKYFQLMWLASILTEALVLGPSQFLPSECTYTCNVCKGISVCLL